MKRFQPSPAFHRRRSQQSPRARRIINFRNRLTHEYPTVDDALVWAIVETDVPVLQRECVELLKRTAPADEEGSQETGM
ncbi:MAG: DUF86 domain-containing protein [Lentisphaerae bacterium]|nr:DUF86 domain-containing protein [Lentisphaerota bacterium]